jgi:hypothetical protein
MIIINAIANIIITSSVAMFMIFVFGRSNMMQTIHWLERVIIKIGLALLSAGSLFNFLTLDKPSSTELTLNIGLSIVFGWGAYFHFKYFVKNK